MADQFDLAEQPTRKTKAQRLAEVHERAMKRFDAIWGVVAEERKQALRDRRFGEFGRDAERVRGIVMLSQIFQPRAGWNPPAGYVMSVEAL